MPLPFEQTLGRNREIVITSDTARTPNVEDDNHILEIDASTTGTDGVVHIGTSASRHALGTTAGREGVRLNFSSAAVSGTARGLDVRMTQTGAAGESDCFRAFETVNCLTTTCRGAHISLNFSAVASGSACSGLGTPLQTTLHIPDIASWAPTGTLAAMVAEIYSDGTDSDPAGLTELSVLRLCNSGGTGKADVDTDASIFSLQGWTAASGVTNAITSTKLNELTAVTHVGIRVNIGGTLYYIPAFLAAEWN